MVTRRLERGDLRFHLLERRLERSAAMRIRCTRRKYLLSLQIQSLTRPLLRSVDLRPRLHRRVALRLLLFY